MDTSIQTEKVFYQDKNVTVTQSRFVSYEKTYAMRNISSVANFRIIKSRAIAYVLLLFGVLIWITGGNGTALGIILTIIAVVLLFTIKDEFSVRISTNSGETNGLISKDYNYVQSIVNALNEAIIYRG